MAIFLRLVILGMLQIGSLEPYANALSIQKPQQGISNPGFGCACPCGVHTATFRTWQQKDGPPDQFSGKAIRRWLHGLNKVYADTGSSSPAKGPKIRRTELLILLGRSPRGLWSLEAHEDEAGIRADLVCTTMQAKRKVFRVVEALDIYLQSVESSLASRVSRRLRQLAKTGQWDRDSLVPVDLPLRSEFPALVFRPRGAPESSTDWTLSVRTRDRRLVRIMKGGSYFRGAKSFGGVRDDANGQIWWILINTAGGDACYTEWLPIRLIEG